MRAQPRRCEHLTTFRPSGCPFLEYSGPFPLPQHWYFGAQAPWQHLHMAWHGLCGPHETGAPALQRTRASRSARLASPASLGDCVATGSQRDAAAKRAFFILQVEQRCTSPSQMGRVKRSRAGEGRPGMVIMDMSNTREAERQSR